MFQVTYTPRKSLSMYFNYRYKQKERDVTGTSGAVIEPIYHHKLRYRLTYMPGRYIFRTTIDYNHFRQQDGKGIALIDGKVISVLNFARTLSFLCQFPCREPGFIRTITIRVFTPPSVDCYILSIPLPSMAKGSVTPLICDMI